MAFEPICRKMFPFWEKISDADKEYICQNSHIYTYPKGRNIQDSSECSGVILVRSGSLNMAKNFGFAPVFVHHFLFYVSMV